MAVDAGAGIPAAVGLMGIIYFHRDNVPTAEIQVGTKVIMKTDVAVRTVTEVVSINPNLTVLVHAVKLDNNGF